MKDKKINSTSTAYQTPVIAILGHVDHGKTTLLDYIRKTNVAKGEVGGITQHIGAYQIPTPPLLLKKSKEKIKKITFIDTPGHEAFIKMRSRGVTASDIAILVVDAKDGVAPQTEESLKIIKEAKLPFIVAINKIDLPNVNIEKVKKKITSLGVNLEEYGGETPVVAVSAKTGQGVDKLLEVILLLSDLFLSKKDSEDKLTAVIIESSLSKHKGPVATIIVKKGTLEVGLPVFCEGQEFRIRAILDWNGKNLTSISAGDPGEILGWKQVPQVGSLVESKKDEFTKISKKTNLDRSETPTSSSADQIKIMLKTDTWGSLEAVLQSLPKDVSIVSSSVGAISESDILMAKTTRALIIGFNVSPSAQIDKLAKSEKVIMKSYKIIYELTAELEDLIATIKEGNLVRELGKAKIIATFKFDESIIAGIKVISGRIARGDNVKIVRNNQELGRAHIKSLKHLKEDITKVENGGEAGVLLSQKVDFLTGDSIISIG